MKVGISVKIDVTKIDKALLYKGEKGTYLNLTTFVDLDDKDQYDNDGFISQEQSKEDRNAGAPPTPILGNVRVFWKDEHNQQQGGQQQRQAPPKQEEKDPFFDDDIGF